MGLFIKKEMTSPAGMHYTISGMDRKRMIVGLGNPGDDYALTRHNIGFEVLDKLAGSYDVGFVTKKDLKSLVAVVQDNGLQVILAKPMTFMNDSGESVQLLKNFYKMSDSEILVIHDEIDIPFADLRQKLAGGSAGHNGVKSVINTIGEGFARLRLGIGPKTPEQMDTADFVLQKFSGTEKRKLPGIVKKAAEQAQTWLQG